MCTDLRMAKKWRGCVLSWFWCYFCSSLRRPPNCEITFVDAAVHEAVIGDAPPAVWHSCFCCVSVGTLMPSFTFPFPFPLSLHLSPDDIFPRLPDLANAMFPFPTAIVPAIITAARAAIATSAVDVLWFISHWITPRFESSRSSTIHSDNWMSQLGLVIISECF